MRKTTTNPESDEPAADAAGKGRPTPTRKEREAANRRPIVVADRAEARRRAREADRVERERFNAGYAAGDERFLPLRDRGAQKKFVRDYVDARFSAGEIMIIVMFAVIVLMYLPFDGMALVGTVALFGYFAIVVVDSVILGATLTKRLREKYGDRAERVRWYAAMRAMQMRPMRMPKPQVKRWQFPS